MSYHKFFKSKIQKGFTVVDLLIVMATIAILFGLVSVNILNVQDKANINTTVNTLVSDIRTQQLKAMVGDTDGEAVPGSYGIHFDENSYTLFYGSVYHASQSGNIVIELPETLVFQDISFPMAQVVFEEGNGEVVGFINAQNAVTLANTSSEESETIRVNKYGAIIEGP